MAVLQRKAPSISGRVDSHHGDDPSDVFSRVIEAAQRNGMSLEAWLQDAVLQNEAQEDHLSPDELTLKKLLQTQRQSRQGAERAAQVAEQALLDDPTDQEPDAESQALMHAIDDLSQQLGALKAFDAPKQADRPELRPASQAVLDSHVEAAVPNPSDTSDAPENAIQEDAQTVEELRARILALKERIVPSDTTPPETKIRQTTARPAEPIHALPEEEIYSDDDLEHELELALQPTAPPVTLDGYEDYQEDDLADEADYGYQEDDEQKDDPARNNAAQQEAALNETMEAHFALLGEKINTLLEKADTETKSQNDEIREQLDSNLALLESKISELPTRNDVAILQPMAKMQVKLQEDQTRLDRNFKKLADDHIRLQNSATQSQTASQIPALQDQISKLEASLKSMKPALSRDVASLLDLTVQKLEKSARNKPDAVTNAALQTHLAQLEKTLKDLPAEIAQQQPNAQSLISFLPPRETLESIEHTVGRLEGIMLEQQTTLSDMNIGDQTQMFKERFDGLLSRLDDTMKRFDSASLEADRRADENLKDQKSQNTSFIKQLTAQIESLERRIEEAPNENREQAAAADAAHQHMQDDMARIETQLSTVMEQLGQQLAKPDPVAPAGPDASVITKAVSDAVVVPLNEALNRVERGLDARSRQTLDDLSALVKSTAKKPNSDDALHNQLSSVPDTLTILLNKIHDLESGVDRLEATQKKLTPAAGKEESRRPRFRKAAQAQADVIPPKAAEPKRNAPTPKTEKDADLEVGMNYIAAARRATKKGGQTAAPVGKAAATEKTPVANKTVGKTASKTASADPKSVEGIKQRAEGILSQQREELKRERNPARRKKILGVCLGLTLIVAAVALALKTYQSQQGPDDNLATGSISKPIDPGKDRKLTTNSAMVKPIPIPTGQKLPDRLPGGIDRIKALGDSVFAERNAVTKIATPVAKPKITRKASTTPLQRTFVAPAPATNIGPLPLRYKAVIGDPVAQFEIGSRYADGFGTTPNMPKAVEWYRRASDQGLAPAQYRLGSLLEHGRGTTKNLTAAADLYKKAAEKGNTKAMYNLGVLHAQGTLGEPNFTEASKWFRMAANAGVKDSQFNLAILYARGMGVATDLEKAYFWFAVAAKDGDPDAKAKRDALAQDLEADIVAKIDGTVANWGPDRPAKAANMVSMPNEGWIAVKVPKNAEAQLKKHAEKISDTGPIASNQGADFQNPQGGLSDIPLAKFDESAI
ncbi:hypothetical protein [Pararhizobium sp. IMCC21322]|uniref:hypothetical protein n=1 Tax=Pararhizobium sp. IMCC21322 TaxID=3067903 RepID=UPI002741B08D|nr:hypothetical protein [Pararhizobium sp. IMCC21322]